MKTVIVDVPESLLEAAGSEVDAKRMMLEGAIAKLVEMGRLTEAQAASISEQSEHAWMSLADSGRSFDFWLDPTEDVYTAEDGEDL